MSQNPDYLNITGYSINTLQVLVAERYTEDGKFVIRMKMIDPSYTLKFFAGTADYKTVSTFFGLNGTLKSKSSNFVVIGNRSINVREVVWAQQLVENGVRVITVTMVRHGIVYTYVRGTAEYNMAAAYFGFPL